jgi:hypothetical protein
MACSVVKILAVSSVLALATTCDAFMNAPSLRPAKSTLRAAGARQGRCSTVAPSMVLTPDRRTASAPTGFGDQASRPPSKVSTCARVAAPRRRRHKILAAEGCHKKNPWLFIMSHMATLPHHYRPFASTSWHPLPGLSRRFMCMCAAVLSCCTAVRCHPSSVTRNTHGPRSKIPAKWRHEFDVLQQACWRWQTRAWQGQSQ